MNSLWFYTVKTKQQPQSCT